MEPRFELITEKNIIGKKIQMTMADNKTAEVWKSFMPRRKEIVNAVSSELISMQRYLEPLTIKQYDPHAKIEKWAAVEVADHKVVPHDMDTYTIPAGLYVVFIHKGPASTGIKTFSYIFGTWLPTSEYVIDERPHFELLGEKYKNEAPDSEEEVWIPIRRKD